uniref:Glucosaminyl (N-acetyl) transferase 4 n=1 Tax=Oreochromis niloticus TaxID=8128 RepID=I3KE70_ORENI
MTLRCLSLRLRRKQFLPSILSLLTICVLLLFCVKHSYITEPSHIAMDMQIIPKYNIDCSAIYDMDPVEVGKSLLIKKKDVVESKDESLAYLTSNCTLFRKYRGYDNVCVTEEEQDFPIAYSLVVHKSAWMVERLINALYSPSNIYCIHYDQKSSVQFISAMEGLAQCLPNVFITSKKESVYYASISRLKADLNCLSDLLGSEVKWKYVINLCGQDFPLKSNVELVSELKKLNGRNMLETSRPTPAKKQRFTFHHELKDASFEYQKLPVKTEYVKNPPPHNIEVFSGNAYFVLSRKFIEHMNASGVPGEVPRSKPDITDLMSKTRLVKWQYLEEQLYPPCTGTHVRSVCIYGAAEMRWLLNYGHWFANKFDPKVDPVLIQCLEEKLKEKQKLFQSVSLTCHKG